MKSNSENRDRDDVVGIVAHLTRLMARKRWRGEMRDLVILLSANLCDECGLDCVDVTKAARELAHAMERVQ